MQVPEKTDYCWGCGTDTRALQLHLASWLCRECITSLAPTIEAERLQNEETKTRPCISTDCNAGDHASCEGEESALWPDATFSVRQCSCICHRKDLNASSITN